MPGFAVVIVSPPGYPHSRAFEEVQDALHFGLARAGFDSVREINRCPAGRTAIILGANLLGRNPRLPADAILFNLEQIVAGSTWLTTDYVELLRGSRVWDYSERNAAALRHLGVTDVRVVPLGYVPELTRIPAAAKDIDVLFYGSGNARRQAVLTALHEGGATVKAVFGAYGAERDALIARSRVVINIHFYEARILEIARVGYLLANRACVATEHSVDADLEGELAGGLVVAPYEELAATCLRYLKDDAAREGVARRGFELFSRRDQAAFLASTLGG